MRDQRFTLVLDIDEKRLLARLADRLQRSQSDVIRWLFRKAAQEFGWIAADDPTEFDGSQEANETLRWFAEDGEGGLDG